MHNMSLKIKSWKKYQNKILVGIILIALCSVVLRLIIWENNYYAGMEGKERAVATSSTTAPEPVVDETEVTEEQRIEYIVAADMPRYLTIPKLSINNARVLQVGVNQKGQMDTPMNIYDVGWYAGSAKPGTGGTSIIDGHNGGPNFYGVFKRTPNLQPGDQITIEMGDGTQYNYKVVDNSSVRLENADNQMLYAATSPEEGKESITLITCTGEWSQTQQTYLSRQFTRAIRI